MRLLLLTLPLPFILLAVVAPGGRSVAASTLRGFGAQLGRIRRQALGGGRATPPLSDLRSGAAELIRWCEGYLRWRGQVLAPALATYSSAFPGKLSALILEENAALGAALSALQRALAVGAPGAADATSRVGDILVAAEARCEDDVGAVSLLELGLPSGSFERLVTEPTRRLLCAAALPAADWEAMPAAGMDLGPAGS